MTEKGFDLSRKGALINQNRVPSVIIRIRFV